MKILISGSTGTLGVGLTKYLSTFKKYKIIKLGYKNKSQYNVDFTNKKEVIFFLNNIQPDYIINLFCLANVDECEKNYTKALIYNSDILNCLSSWSQEYNCKIIHISTDQVYDNINNYSIEKDINLKNNYAHSKFKGEQYLNNENSCVLRTNFFGFSNTKKTLNEWFLNSIQHNKDIYLFNDIQFNPVSMDTLYKCINFIICNFKHGVYNYGTKNGLTKSEFCKKLMKNLNIEYKKINTVSVDQSNLFAYRPKGMMMNTDKFIKNFKFKVPNIDEEINEYINKYLIK